ncbi:hypothetical protein, partial [Oenococcus oeni]|uniref:hypothetical protein n=1 Tax=Oenococcus oeni TaxID=1247 RepID=UPI0015D66C00
LPKFGKSHTCKGIINYKGFLVSWGNTNKAIHYPDTIFISDISDPESYPGDWGFELDTDDELDYTKPITASKGGFLQLSSIGGAILACKQLGDSLYAFTDNEIFQINYVGGID